MGSDWHMKRCIEEALNRAWSKWVKGASFSNTQAVARNTTTPTSSLHYDSDSEYDSRESEIEHNNDVEVETFTTLFDNSDLESGIHTLSPLSCCHIHGLIAGDPVKVSKVWELGPHDRRRLIRTALRDRYQSALENFKESIRQYNMIREVYEVRFAEPN